VSFLGCDGPAAAADQPELVESHSPLERRLTEGRHGAFEIGAMDDSGDEAPALDAGDLVRVERPVDHAQLPTRRRRHGTRPVSALPSAFAVAVH